MKKAYKNPLLRIIDTLLDEEISDVNTSGTFDWTQEDDELTPDDPWQGQ